MEIKDGRPERGQTGKVAHKAEHVHEEAAFDLEKGELIEVELVWYERLNTACFSMQIRSHRVHFIMFNPAGHGTYIFRP